MMVSGLKAIIEILNCPASPSWWGGTSMFSWVVLPPFPCKMGKRENPQWWTHSNSKFCTLLITHHVSERRYYVAVQYIATFQKSLVPLPSWLCLEDKECKNLHSASIHHNYTVQLSKNKIHIKCFIQLS